LLLEIEVYFCVVVDGSPGFAVGDPVTDRDLLCFGYRDPEAEVTLLLSVQALFLYDAGVQVEPLVMLPVFQVQFELVVPGRKIKIARRQKLL